MVVGSLFFGARGNGASGQNEGWLLFRCFDLPNSVFYRYLCGLFGVGISSLPPVGRERKVRATQSTVLLNGKLSATARLKVTENNRLPRFASAGKGEKAG